MLPDGLELLEEIGCGGTGVVYRARQRDLGRLVAVKFLRTPALPSAREVQALREEAELIARLDHPNIVPVYGVGEDEGRPYLVMKLIEGEDLGRWRVRQTVDFEAIGRIMAAVAGAVQHAHERGVLHRDLKPTNILVDSEKRPHVVDFGLSRRLQESCSISSTSMVLGTLGYASPEQATGSKTLGVTSDVYSLGAILYELLTGRVPLEGPTPYQTLLLIQEREPDPPRAHDTRLDPALEAVCLKCLKKDPKRRYQSAAELEQDLRRWLAGAPVLAKRPGRYAFLTRFWRNRVLPLVRAARRPALGLLTLTLVAVLTTKWLIVPQRQAAAVREALPQLEAQMGQAEACLRGGNFDLGRKVVQKLTFTGSLALDDIKFWPIQRFSGQQRTFGDLRRDYEWVVAHGYLFTIKAGDVLPRLPKTEPGETSTNRPDLNQAIQEAYNKDVNYKRSLALRIGEKEVISNPSNVTPAFDAHIGKVMYRRRPLCWSADGKRIVTGWGTVYDGRTGEPLHEEVESRDQLREMGIELDEDRKQTLSAKEIKRAQERSNFYLGSNEAREPGGWGRCSPDGKQIITSGGYGYYNVWDLSKWDVELDFPRRTIKDEPIPPSRDDSKKVPDRKLGEENKR